MKTEIVLDNSPIVAHYISALEPKRLKRIVDNLKKRLKGLDFQAIACSGVSGLIVAGPLCYELDKYPIIVRKEKDDCHSSKKVEGVDGVFNYIILDDLICSGHTMKMICEKMVENRPKAKLVKIVIYNDSANYCPDDILRPEDKGVEILNLRIE